MYAQVCGVAVLKASVVWSGCRPGRSIDGFVLTHAEVKGSIHCVTWHMLSVQGAGTLLEQGYEVDRYTIEGVLGRGGMAVVYRARHRLLGSTHAMKVIEVPSPAMRERLLAEGQVQSSLRHPNIASVTDLIVVNGTPALIMEYVNGPALDALVAQGPLSLSQADYLARQIISGMAAAHRHGLIHRDLKPSNVMLEVSGDVFTPKIIDFGLVKKTDESSAGRTRTGMTMGTPAYMAPEQVRDAKHIDKRADIFALGTILYELVTGKRAFNGTDTFEIFRSIADGAYVDPLELVPDLPNRVVQTIRTALQTDPNARYPDCEALLAAWVADSVRLTKPVEPWDTATLEMMRVKEQQFPIADATSSLSMETFASSLSVDTDAGNQTWAADDPSPTLSDSTAANEAVGWGLIPNLLFGFIIFLKRL